jgi:hypothetical protein
MTIVLVLTTLNGNDDIGCRHAAPHSNDDPLSNYNNHCVSDYEKYFHQCDYYATALILPRV